VRALNIILKIILLVAIVTALLLPFYIWILAAGSHRADISVSGGYLSESPPDQSIPDISVLVISSFAYTVPTAIVGAFLHTVIAYGLGYGLARGHFPLKEELKLLCFLALLVPTTVIIGPVFWLNSRLGLQGHFAAMFLAMWLLPWLALIFYLYLARLPERMELYAAIDGLSPRQVFAQLILPYSYKGLIAVFLLAFLFNYHSLFAAAAALPTKEFHGEPSVSFSYLPMLISIFRQSSAAVPDSTKLLAALACQAPSVIALPLLIIYGIPVVQTITLGRFIHRRKISIFGSRAKKPAAGAKRI
jgi:ABC-type glycerol-3-phosphate transport system permease component